MFIQVLLKDKIDTGFAIVEALRGARFPITAAFWCRIPESGYWRLVIGSKLVERIGPHEGYRRLQAILHRLNVGDELSGSISPLSPSDPTYLGLQQNAQSPGQFSLQAGLGAAVNVFQDAYIYSL